MAGFGDLLQRIARSLEEAGAQQPGDDLRARLGYGAGDDDKDESDWEWEPEAALEPEPGPEPAAKSKWEPETVWSPKAARAPAGAPAAPQEFEVMRVSPAEREHRRRHPSPGALPRADASPAPARSERIRARLHTADALREAFVVKELLDRPLGQRRRR